MDYFLQGKVNSEYVKLIELFNKRFLPEKCQQIARAPGRVNLIGEHIDYCGYSVLPMALEQNVTMAFSVLENEEGISLVNTNAAYSEYENLSNVMEIEKSKPLWFHYFFCGYKGIQDYATEHKLPFPKFRLCVFVDGNIPPSAGLSSSSAMVCCSAIVTMRAAGLNISKVDLAAVCAHCERYIGTEGGGMDQAISLLAEAGTAKFVIFKKPIETQPVLLPKEAVFVVANSLVENNKAASNQYNKRVVECRTAAKLLTKLLSPHSDWRSVRRLIEVQDLCNTSLTDMTEAVCRLLHEEPFTRTELAALLEISDEEFATLCLGENTKEMTEFKLRQRALHVYSEAERVIRFREACKSGTGLEELGQLMNESHISCSQLYECSCPELDRLTSLCISGGALGSRLTGAGWGGCTVSLLYPDKVDHYLEHLRSTYYSGQGDATSAIFVSQPGGGAAIYNVD